MKELFSLLTESEKKKLRGVALLLIAGVIFLIIMVLGERRSVFNLENRLQARQKVLAEAQDKRAKAAADWAKWQATYRDIEELEKSFFYRGPSDLHQLRLDLEKIMAEAGVSAKTLKYDYSPSKKETIDKIQINFNFVGSYVILKRFLEVVERFPKSLMLEKIDFARIAGDGQVLELRIVLAGYYEEQ